MVTAEAVEVEGVIRETTWSNRNYRLSPEGNASVLGAGREKEIKRESAMLREK